LSARSVIALPSRSKVFPASTGNYAQFCFGSDADCFDTDHWRIETHVLIRLWQP
jgi:hypothetical protein